MRDALIYLVDSLLTIYLYILVLRFVMQMVRADFRNQLANAVLIVTNPLIMPLRRIFPPVGKVDSASVLAIVLVAAGRHQVDELGGSLRIFARHIPAHLLDDLFNFSRGGVLPDK